VKATLPAFRRFVASALTMAGLILCSVDGWAGPAFALPQVPSPPPDEVGDKILALVPNSLKDNAVCTNQFTNGTFASVVWCIYDKGDPRFAGLAGFDNGSIIDFSLVSDADWRGTGDTSGRTELNRDDAWVVAWKVESADVDGIDLWSLDYHNTHNGLSFSVGLFRDVEQASAWLDAMGL
jgi:hypothetical protein